MDKDVMKVVAQERIERIRETDSERASCIENALAEFNPEVQDIAFAVVMLDRALKKLVVERNIQANEHFSREKHSESTYRPILQKGGEINDKKQQ